MLRRIGAVLAGFAAFALVASGAVLMARAGWLAYAEAEPARAYSLTMLLVRLAAGASATFVGGWVAAKVDRGAGQATLLFGALLLAISVVWHIRIWDQYPVWYHLVWFACIVPSAVLGGKLVRKNATR